jgi:hypothetical protein
MSQMRLRRWGFRQAATSQDGLSAAKPILSASGSQSDGYRFAQPILQAAQANGSSDQLHILNTSGPAKTQLSKTDTATKMHLPKISSMAGSRNSARFIDLFNGVFILDADLNTLAPRLAALD